MTNAVVGAMAATMTALQTVYVVVETPQDEREIRKQLEMLGAATSA